jgi:ATP-binding cassette subfamily C protein
MKRAVRFALFSVVFQQIEIYAFTVAENVAMRYRDTLDDGAVHSALERAGLGDRVRTLPQGIDTMLLKNIDLDGVELSGGENQRLRWRGRCTRTRPSWCWTSPRQPWIRWPNTACTRNSMR